MPESVIRPEVDHEQDSQPSEAQAGEQILPVKNEAETTTRSKTEATTAAPGEKIIWTPGFLLTFALTLVLGVSAESLLTQSWVNGLFTGQLIIQAHVILATLGWLVLGIVTRSRWIRIGCVFGGIWAAFMTLNIFINVQGIAPGTPVQSYINVATCIALLGAYIGLSIEGTLLTSWDTWLFLLIPPLGAGGVALTYLLTPQASILTVENAIAAGGMIACWLCWWLRPSCWKKQPGPTFIFGLIPAILLAMAFLNTSAHNFFLVQVISPHLNIDSNANNFFFAQVILLCLLLGCTRMAKSELNN